MKFILLTFFVYFLAVPAIAGYVPDDPPLHRLISMWCSPKRIEISQRLKLNPVCKPNSITDQVRSLIHTGADVNQVGEAGETPLRAAIRLNNVEVIGVLLDAGADVNQVWEGKGNSNRAQRGDTPLMGAVNWYPEFNDIKPLQLLLAHGAAVNYRNGERYMKDCDLTTQGKCTWLGQTALTRAAEDGYYPVVKLLLHYGADPNLPREDGKTPAEIAQVGRHRKIADLLEASAKRAAK